MSKINVCVRFCPFNSKEKTHQDIFSSVRRVDQENFIFKDEKEEELILSFDRVFYEDSTQADIFDFIAMLVIADVVNGINGTIMTYGQTGAGKTFSMEGPGISISDEKQAGLLMRVMERLFQYIGSSGETKHIIKVSMVEIYMEKVRDLFDLSNDSIQIKESKNQKVLLSGVTEKIVTDSKEALKHLSGGIANRAVGETQMHIASSRSHCLYIICVEQGSSHDERIKGGKLILVDLAGSEKVEKTGAEGKVLEEAKTINKSLSALGNVINALSSDKVNHVPYRDSKLTRILQDALSGNCRISLFCCCSPSSSDASESLSTLRFGARTKQMKLMPKVPTPKEKRPLPVGTSTSENEYQCKIKTINRMLNKLRMSIKEHDLKSDEEYLFSNGLMFESLDSFGDLEEDNEESIDRTVSALVAEVKMLQDKAEKLTGENMILKAAAVIRIKNGSKLHRPWNAIREIWRIAVAPFRWIVGMSASMFLSTHKMQCLHGSSSSLFRGKKCLLREWADASSCVQ